MREFLKKYASRKFIVSLISAISGVVVLFVGNGQVVEVISSALMVIVPAIVYCIIEGKIDANSVKQIADAASDAAGDLGADEKVAEAIDQIGDTASVFLDNN